MGDGDATGLANKSKESLRHQVDRALDKGFEATWYFLPIEVRVALLVALEMESEMDVYNHPFSANEDLEADRVLKRFDDSMDLDDLRFLIRTFQDPLRETNS